MKKIWVDKYRPLSVNDYVWINNEHKELVQRWINEHNIVHMILAGPAGTGKSSLIQVLINELDIPKGDILSINASSETSVETVREKIMKFVPTIPFGDFKICILEEADALSYQAQNSLKMVISDYSDNCRFIFTTNNPHKIDEAIKSRCMFFEITNMSQEDFIGKMTFILDEENIKYTDEALLEIFQNNYPDLRQTINCLEQASSSGELILPKSTKVDDVYGHVISLFQDGKIQQAREYLVGHVSKSDYLNVYRFLYQNVNLWSDDKDTQDRALVVIRDGMYKANFVADEEINLSATLAELSLL